MNYQGTLTTTWFFNGSIAEIEAGLAQSKEAAERFAKSLLRPCKASDIPLKEGNRKERRRLAAENRRAKR